MDYIDLHVHSTESDGTYSPTEIVRYAEQKKLHTIALTDHDTISGIDEALAAARGKTLQVIPGIEFSCLFYRRDIHILGLFIDHKNETFKKEVALLEESRARRNREMIARLSGGGIPISWDEMTAHFGSTIWTRANFGKYLIDKGICTSMKEAFALYVGNDTEYYVPRVEVDPQHILRIIQKSGGISILAHPFLYHFTLEELRPRIEELKEMGLMGIEVFYSLHSREQENFIKKTAEDLQLFISGGSDFHGANKPDIDLGCGKGNLRIPSALLNPLISFSKD